MASATMKTPISCNMRDDQLFIGYNRTHVKIIKLKDETTNNISNISKELNTLTIKINSFNLNSYNLYDLLSIINSYDVYISWEKSYNSLLNDIDVINNTISDLDFKINYIKNIKPRLIKYNSLKKQYDDWIDYDYKLKIIRTNKFFELQNIINDYELSTGC